MTESPTSLTAAPPTFSTTTATTTTAAATQATNRHHNHKWFFWVLVVCSLLLALKSFSASIRFSDSVRRVPSNDDPFANKAQLQINNKALLSQESTLQPKEKVSTSSSDTNHEQPIMATSPNDIIRASDHSINIKVPVETNRSEPSSSKSMYAQQSFRKPLNILVFYGDDWRHDQLGHLNPLIYSPVIDREIAEKGIRFTHNCVTTSICGGEFLLRGCHHLSCDHNHSRRFLLLRCTSFACHLSYRSIHVSSWYTTDRRFDSTVG
jgi:hypothetical protein